IIILNLKVLLQLFTISSEVYILLKITVQNENLNIRYIKSEDLDSLSRNLNIISIELTLTVNIRIMMQRITH
ncbi:hypothetical protein BDFG_03391, partial [Blastomyces dermatitidis ATCC 26199]